MRDHDERNPHYAPTGGRREEVAVRDTVFLRKDPIAWKRVPPAIKAELTQGIARVERARSAIVSAATIPWMPRVVGFAQVWLRPDGEGSIDGQLGVERLGGVVQPCAKLPAQSIVCDEGVIRRLLVHEFAHCFDHADAGGEGPVPLPQPDDPFDDHEHDESMLADPAQWFGEEDVRDFVRWNSEVAESIHRRLFELRLHACLPAVTPPMRIDGDVRLEFPQAVAERIRAARAQRATKEEV
jgi:hypothetical protein